ncbi:hypothetical protein [Leptotrichia alba]|uniref:Uncharacterized protein n=1 Tax=Leptotrichia alba TaxID=3239304 RepID=A0AB39V694_9FUSO
MKKILGLTAIMVLAMSQISFSAYRNTDADVKRLIKLGKQKQSHPAKEIETVTTESNDDEVEVVPAGEATSSEKARRMTEDAKAKAEAKIEKEKLAAQRKTEAKQLRAQRKNMSESKMMDIEIQRIKRRVEKINSNIEKYNHTNEMLEQMEERLDAIQNKLN